MMREVLVNYAASRNAFKRGGGMRRSSFDEALAGTRRAAMSLDDLLAVNEALKHLAVDDERCATVVELMFFRRFQRERSGCRIECL